MGIGSRREDAAAQREHLLARGGVFGQIHARIRNLHLNPLTGIGSGQENSRVFLGIGAPSGHLHIVPETRSRIATPGLVKVLFPGAGQFIPGGPDIDGQFGFFDAVGIDNILALASHRFETSEHSAHTKFADASIFAPSGNEAQLFQDSPIFQPGSGKEGLKGTHFGVSIEQNV